VTSCSLPACSRTSGCRFRTKASLGRCFTDRAFVGPLAQLADGGLLEPAESLLLNAVGHDRDQRFSAQAGLASVEENRARASPMLFYPWSATELVAGNCLLLVDFDLSIFLIHQGLLLQASPFRSAWPKSQAKSSVRELLQKPGYSALEEKVQFET